MSDLERVDLSTNLSARDPIISDAARVFQSASISPETIRGYSRDWNLFLEWCQIHQVSPIPASPIAISNFIADMAMVFDDEKGSWAYSPATIRRVTAAIGKAHSIAGLPSPCTSESVKMTLAGIYRKRGARPKRMKPLLIDDLASIISKMDFNTWPTGVRAHRDAAILLIGFGGAFRRSEIAAMPLRDVTLHANDGIHLLLERSKTDQEGRGQVKAIPYGLNPITCAPCAFVRLVRILAAQEISRIELASEIARTNIYVHDHNIKPYLARLNPDTPLIQSMVKGGRFTGKAAGGAAIHAVVREHVESAGYDPNLFGGHSLRAGFVTQAFRNGATHHEIMSQTGHKNPSTVEIYAREDSPLIQNAATKLGM